MKGTTMRIQIAGPGCPNCQTTEKNVFNACAELDLPADISHIYNVAEFVSLGVTRTPAVLVDGEIILAGRVPTVQDLVTLISAKRG
jgi:small redox-active disulfide protein 2